MIQATIKYSGTFIDRPNIHRISIDENDIAAEKALPNGKKVTITVGKLYNIFWTKQSYSVDGTEPEDEILPEHFEMWFRKKYLETQNYYERIISIEYNLV